jgi:hypothetical protein
LNRYRHALSHAGHCDFDWANVRRNPSTCHSAFGRIGSYQRMSRQVDLSEPSCREIGARAAAI